MPYVLRMGIWRVVNLDTEKPVMEKQSWKGLIRCRAQTKRPERSRVTTDGGMQQWSAIAESQNDTGIYL